MLLNEQITQNNPQKASKIKIKKKNKERKKKTDF